MRRRSMILSTHIILSLTTSTRRRSSMRTHTNTSSCPITIYCRSTCQNTSSVSSLSQRWQLSQHPIRAYSYASIQVHRWSWTQASVCPYQGPYQGPYPGEPEQKPEAQSMSKTMSWHYRCKACCLSKGHHWACLRPRGDIIRSGRKGFQRWLPLQGLWSAWAACR